MFVSGRGAEAPANGSAVRAMLAKALVYAVIGCVACSEATNAKADMGGQASIIIIQNDRGGLISRRLAEIDKIRSLGRKVEIRGRICLSSCTMYLGLPDTCILPETSFGFHGPTRYGIRLNSADFEYWSRIVASHYPEPLKSWYMREGRQRMSGFSRVSGARLIEMGVPRCSTTAVNSPGLRAAGQSAPEAVR